MERIIYNFKNNLISLIYTIFGTELIFHSVYRQFELIFVIAIAVSTILLFAFYCKVDEAKEKGPAIYIPLALVIIVLSFIAINIGGAETDTKIIEWAFKGGRDLENNLGFTLGALLIIAFLFSSMFYYFTVKIIRMSVLLLLYFVVMILYIKGPYISGNIVVYGLIVSFVLLFIENTKGSNISESHKLNIKIKDLGILIGIFVSIIITIILINPMVKIPKITPLDSLKSYFQNSILGGQNGFSVDSNTSRNINESTTNNPDKVLYTIKAKENPVYMISHNFDVYEGGKWIQGNKDFLYGEDISSFDGYQDLDKTKQILNIIDKNEFEKTLNPEEMSNFQKILDSKETENRGVAVIEPKVSDSYQIIHPSKMNYFNDMTRGEISYINGFDELFKTKGESYYADYQYTATYYKDIPERSSKDFQIMTFFNEEKYLELLKLSNDNKEIKEIEDIKKTYTQLGNDTSKNIYDLSKSLTKDKVSTYDKAMEIENYFNAGEYIYNLTLPTNDGNEGYIDYFIFEGKKGYCVQYATAMTLLCRASGISARYVEGYAIDDYKDKITEGEYQVNASRAHAFVEVYIPGFGWKIFDPTPGIVSQSEEVVQVDTQETIKNYNEWIKIPEIIIAIFTVLLIVVIFLKVTKRSRAIRKILKLPNEEALEGIISDTIKLLSRVDIVPKKGEASLTFAIRVDESINIGLRRILESYYNYKYAMDIVSKEQLKEAILINKKTYEYIKVNRK